MFVCDNKIDKQVEVAQRIAKKLKYAYFLDNNNYMKNIILLILLAFCQAVHSQQLYIYGGSNHDDFLGSLNSSIYDSNSICNEYGTYGNKYSSYSPWNEYAAEPPVIVDRDGNFYGYFTVNKYKPQRADFNLALIMYKYHDLIREDISKWYKKIFQGY